MKKILLGTIAAVTVLGASAASAQTLEFPRLWNERAAPAAYGQDYQRHYSHYTTSPYANTGNSVGYNLNIADPTNLGG